MQSKAGWGGGGSYAGRSLQGPGRRRWQGSGEEGGERRASEGRVGAGGAHTWEWVTMPVTEMVNREGGRGRSAEDEFHSLAAEDDSPTMMQEEMPGAEKIEDAWPLPYPALQTLLLPPLTLWRALLPQSAPR